MSGVGAGQGAADGTRTALVLVGAPALAATEPVPETGLTAQCLRRTHMAARQEAQGCSEGPQHQAAGPAPEAASRDTPARGQLRPSLGGLPSNPYRD